MLSASELLRRRSYVSVNFLKLITEEVIHVSAMLALVFNYLLARTEHLNLTKRGF